MNTIEIICGAALILIAIGIIVLTALQENKSKGLSGIMGGNDMMTAGRNSSNDAKMAQATKVLGVLFVVVILLVSVLSVRLG